MRAGILKCGPANTSSIDMTACPDQDKDGSFGVSFGPEAPAGKEANWIQTVPDKGWNMLWRIYGPLEPWFAKTWRPGDPEVVG